MNNEVISDSQGIYLITLFIVGETFILARAMEAKQDFWLAIIIAMVMTVPFMLMFSRLHKLFPGKDLFDINESVFGKFLGKIISFLLIYYVASNMISVMRVFTDFISFASLQGTPLAIPFIGLAFVCIWAVKQGIKLMGTWCDFFLPVIVVFLFIGIMLLIPEMKPNNLSPFLFYGIKPVMIGALSTFFFPLTETIAFVMIFAQFKNKNSANRIYLYGLLYGGIFMLILVFTEVMVLGVKTTASQYFPGYGTFSRLDVAGIIHRFEIISGATFILGGFLKVSVLLLAVCRGIAKIFNCEDYRFVVTPTALVISNVSYFFYESTMFMFQWIRDVWGYFAFPFQFIIPIIIWIAAEIKMKLVVNNK